MEDKIPIIYEDIVQEINYDTLPNKWIKTNLESFSKDIQLFEYQQNALKNAIKLLYNYFEEVKPYQILESEMEGIERKKEWCNNFKESEKILIEKLGYSNKNYKQLFEKIEQYYEIKETGNERQIEFFNLVNRMGFWMATGSGKTIVLVKMVEILTNLINVKLIPNNNILILAPREDLIDQIKHIVDKFNNNFTKKIGIWPLKDFEKVKSGSVLITADINIFISESHLISEETKEKQLGFEDFENDGKWYVLLDEAHKGDTSESKRQLYYSLFSRNGFLFNFSATFTDEIDILTTVSNFNLDTFIKQGYGKNVYVSDQEIKLSQTKKDFADEEKQKIVLKSLILLSIAKNSKTKIIEKIPDTYHDPMLVALVNSVSTDEADLKIFFREIEKIAKGNVDKKLFEKAKKEIINEFQNKSQYIFGSQKLQLNENKIKDISIESIHKNIFNSSHPGTIEVITTPNNKELIFKLKSSEEPFAMIKIGEIKDWLKKELRTYEITESITNESYFKKISSDDSSINILMGSRSFYEGWDSERPNVMLFINIGIGNAKKYVMQSIGRGVRIRPFSNERKRLIPLKREGNITAKNITEKLYDVEDIEVMETLFVLGTNKENIKDILNSIKHESKDSSSIIELQKNSIINQREILISTYKKQDKNLDISELPKFNGNKEYLNSYVNWLKDDRLIYAHHLENMDVTMDNILQSKKFLKDGTFEDNTEKDAYNQFGNLIKYTNIVLQDLDKFKQIEDEIEHFKKIGVTLDKSEEEELIKKIKKVKNFINPAEKEKELKKKLTEGEITVEKFTEEIKQIAKYSNEEIFKIEGNKIKIKHMLNHYYVPIITSEQDEINHRKVKHIIDVKSEKEFLKQIEEFAENKNNQLEAFDWWMFCKLDEHLDKVHIPYYSGESNTIRKFHPDFIFWLKKDKRYFIIFVDPKGTQHADYQFKIDGYRQIFEEGNNKKIFKQNNFEIKCYLYLHTYDVNKVAGDYKKYWFDDFKTMIKKFVEEQK
jgi:type III restriction enzyme